MILNGLPWKGTEFILSFWKLHPSTAFWTLLLTMRDTPFLQGILTQGSWQKPFLNSSPFFPNTCQEYKGFGGNWNFPKAGEVDLPVLSLDMCNWRLMCPGWRGSREACIDWIVGTGTLSTLLSSEGKELI